MVNNFLRISLVTAVMCIAATACNKDNCNDSEGRVNTPIADYLYMVEYDDYDLQANLDYFGKLFLSEGPACSQVRKGNFVGRNLDWYINKDAAAIIKMKHTDDHFASIGMVGCFPAFSNEIAKSGRPDDVYRYLPFKTEDGVNEYGLYVGVNVMPTGETSFDQSSWEPHAFGHGAAGTNPSSDMHYSVNYLVRVVLDRAKTVDDAKRVIAGIDWTEPKNYPHENETQSFHWLISDATKSVVLEFMDNVPVYTEAPSITEPSFGNIMTNFTNCLMAKGIIQICGIGYERWDILHDNYASTPESFEGMQELMKKVWFSHTYTNDPLSRDFWLSECSSTDLPAYSLYKNYDILSNPQYFELLQQFTASFEDKSLWHVNDTPLWYSTHTSIYDLKNKKLRVLVHEGFDGMKEFYEVSLD